MGLKTTDYKVKKLGITLPTAYAILDDIQLKRGKATFVIQASREATESLTPIETVIVNVDYKRTEDPFVTAYNTAKGMKEIQQYDPETGEVVTVEAPQPFNGWEDDIITE